ncbi:MAG: polysaccharide biosynthesis/export family protein [Reichenbachiella sp.]
MFKLDNDFTEANLNVAVEYAERNYIIQKDDLLMLEVYTNRGERIVDPNNELQQGQGLQSSRGKETSFSYLVKQDGTVKLPIINEIKLDSLTLNEAEAILEVKYDEYYKNSFVKLSYANKRVVVLGGVGGLIIPLLNENTSLIEVIAEAGGIEFGSKAQNIKLIRGNLANPEIYQINLSTVSGMKKSMLAMEPGDIIYIEPWRRPWFEAMKDITPVLSLLSSTLALVLVLQNL